MAGRLVLSVQRDASLECNGVPEQRERSCGCYALGEVGQVEHSASFAVSTKRMFERSVHRYTEPEVCGLGEWFDSLGGEHRAGVGEAAPPPLHEFLGVQVFGREHKPVNVNVLGAAWGLVEGEDGATATEQVALKLLGEPGQVRDHVRSLLFARRERHRVGAELRVVWD